MTCIEISFGNIQDGLRSPHMRNTYKAPPSLTVKWKNGREAHSRLGTGLIIYISIYTFPVAI